MNSLDLLVVIQETTTRFRLGSSSHGQFLGVYSLLVGEIEMRPKYDTCVEVAGTIDLLANNTASVLWHMYACKLSTIAR